MKAQRLKITEKGWENYSDLLSGVKFTNGISDDPVAPMTALQLGAFLRMEAIDDAAQVGAAQILVTTHHDKAPVVIPLAQQTPDTVAPDQAQKVEVEKYTREELEVIADKGGIGALRQIAEKHGVKGRGIVELITEILKAQER